MIFVTVGTQLPFPRLVEYMVDWSKTHREQVIFQTCDVKNVEGSEMYKSLPLKDYNEVLQRARLIVSHAGIGSILSARAAGRPLVLVPRSASLGEHRSDHQIATAKEFEGRRGIRVAWDVKQISELSRIEIEAPVVCDNPNYDGLVNRIRSFVAA